MYMEQVYKQWKMEKKQSTSGIYETKYHNGSYWLLLRKRKLQSFEISYRSLLLLSNKRLPLLSAALQSSEVK